MPSKRPSRLGAAGVCYDADSKILSAFSNVFFLLLSILKRRPVVICASSLFFGGVSASYSRPLYP